MREYYPEYFLLTKSMVLLLVLLPDRQYFWSQAFFHLLEDVADLQKTFEKRESSK
jgi:hypothetical protein